MLRASLLALGGLFGGALVLGPIGQDSREVRTERVVLVDSHGQEVGFIGSRPDGRFGLSLGPVAGGDAIFLGLSGGRDAVVSLTGWGVETRTAPLLELLNRAGAPAPAQMPPVIPPAVDKPPAPASQAATDVLVYVTKSGEKYHRASCRYAKTASAISLAEAKRRYSPCSVCSPP